MLELWTLCITLLLIKITPHTKLELPSLCSSEVIAMLKFVKIGKVFKIVTLTLTRFHIFLYQLKGLHPSSLYTTYELSSLSSSEVISNVKVLLTTPFLGTARPTARPTACPTARPPGFRQSISRDFSQKNPANNGNNIDKWI